MQGLAMPLIMFTNTSTQQLVIPVYQRNYDWTVDNCNQLLNDLIRLHREQRPSHFFGSIVSAPGGSGYDRLIIDGQQRLTTTSLLLLAAIKAVKDGKMEIENQGLINRAKDTFLLAQYCSNPTNKCKLVPIVKDREAFIKLFDFDESKFVPRSNITHNFKHFYQELTKTPAPFTFDNLLFAIEKLFIIKIDLEQGDDPQLIFESLNSTGLALQEADKIRNYLLMSLPPKEQEEYHAQYWQKIEEATNGKPDKFMRDFLTIRKRLQRPVRLDQLYFRWKEFMDDKDRREVLKDMLNLVRYYHQATSGEVTRLVNDKEELNAKLSRKLRQICNLQIDVINPFLISFLQYAEENELSDNEIWRVFDLIETYLARRIVCGMPSNALTAVFSVLHRDVLKSIEEYTSAGQPLSATYADVLAYHILRRDGNKRMPRDPQFKEEIARHDVYHMPKEYRQFLFERLENFINQETIDVCGEMASSIATIEHVMPQTLTPEWKRMLGDNSEEVQERYLHTLCNLTLTGINSELSNNPFADKKNGTTVNGVHVDGYKASKYRLTQEIANYDTWTENDMLDRSEKIEARLLKLYPTPTSSFQPLPRPTEEVSLDDDEFDPTNRRILGYRLFDTEVKEILWVNLYVNVLCEMYKRSPEKFDTLIDSGHYWLHSHMRYDEKNYAQIGENCYLWKSLSNRTKINVLRNIFNATDTDLGELTFILEPLKVGVSSEAEDIAENDTVDA